MSERSPSAWPRRQPPEPPEPPQDGHDWSHDALHGLARVMRAVRQARAAGDVSEPEETRVAAMLYDLEQMVLARGQG